jgi:hypothetical protein
VEAVPVNAADRDSLDIVTICKADDWVRGVLPRFAALIDEHCSGVVRRHLLLVTDAETGPAAEGEAVAALVEQGWYSVVCRPLDGLHQGRRLLAFDALRSGLLAEFGLREALYVDADTDVVADLRGIRAVAPEADLLWVANPLPLGPVLADLERHGFTPAGDKDLPVLMEPGFFYLRRDLRREFDDMCARYPVVNEFVPGSTYWNMMMLELGPKASRLADEFNRTFWDVRAAATNAKSVHFTGQWKLLQPHVEYDRPDRSIVIRPQRNAAIRKRLGDSPDAIAVVAMFRDNADYLPHAFARFEAWERRGLRLRYHFLENDSTDATATLLAGFLQGRTGWLESRSLAVPYHGRPGGQNYDRVMPLARMRNFIVDAAMAHSPAGTCEWTLLLDSDIFFPDDLLDRMFAARLRDPQPETIGMLTCYTQQLFAAEQVPGISTVCPEMPEWAVADHYFDTFAFQDAHHRHHHPFCAFARCRRCRAGGRPDDPRFLIPADRPIVDAAAAFGGIALVPSVILRDPRIRWTTYGSGFDQDRVLAEHVVFCDRLRTITGRRVVVLQDVDCVYRR